MIALQRAALTGLVVLGIAACGSRSVAPPPDAAARIGSRTVPYADFEAYLASNVGSEIDTALRSEVLSQLFDQFLEEALLERLAVDEELLAPEDSTSPAEVLTASEASGEISRADAERYFETHADRFEHSERVQLRQVLAEDRAVATEVARSLNAGASLDQALAPFSVAPAAGVSGREDELGREDLPPAYASVIFALEPGEVSEIVAADYGFHVFQVIERRAARRLSLSEALPEITRVLRARNVENRLVALVAEARDRYNVEVYVRNLPFNYEGTFTTKDHLGS